MIHPLEWLKFKSLKNATELRSGKSSHGKLMSEN
jgi:hypothetical protein